MSRGANNTGGTSPGHTRRTPLHSRGEPQVWLTGTMLTLALGVIVGLLVIVGIGGVRAFWPRPIERVTLSSGEVFLGVPMREDAFEPEPAQAAALRRAIEEGKAPAGSVDEGGRALRRLYRVGNREILGQPFRWVNLSEITQRERPPEAVLLERREWGVWVGVPRAVVADAERTLPPEQASAPAPERGQTEWGEGRLERTDLGGGRVRERVYLAEGPEAALGMYRRLHADAVAVRDRIEHLKERSLGEVNHRVEGSRLALRRAELRRQDGRATDEEVEAARQAHAATLTQTEAEHTEISARIAELEARDARLRFLVEDPSRKRLAPESQTRADAPLRLSQVVRLVQANTLSAGGKWAVYLDRWREFLADEPREANTEGGVMPVIFGTVVMTLLLSLAVAPMGVVAALYLREYAKQGLIISVVRVAVNNLAGVPSIVYGMFGLGFFCYSLGRYIDGGPAAPWPARVWMIGAGCLVPLIVAAVASRALGRPRPGSKRSLRHAVFEWLTILLAVGSAALVVTLLATNPYFKGFFRERLPTATFGTKGILWAALTLALLTLPVVIVATEEAISAVPRSLREASFGCGASKWQTIRRVVLPRSAPGIMTGLILAMARGAGEVAPLMLVGAVKIAPELPVEPRFPFVHLERSFMHLGFHIYDLGFQSPDSEAARPTVWATTLLLIVIVALLNLTAIWLRARLRRRFHTGAF